MPLFTVNVSDGYGQLFQVERSAPDAVTAERLVDAEVVDIPQKVPVGAVIGGPPTVLPKARHSVIAGSARLKV